jgi:formate dehydrogenase beta subunit
MTDNKTIKLTIDGREIETQAGKSVLDAALEAGIYIPHLCHHPDLPPISACGLCVVEVGSIKELQASCMTPAENGMAVNTRTESVIKMRRLAMELMLAGHPADCGSCNKYLNCELQSLKQYLGCEELSVRRRSKLLPIDNRNPLFVHDPNKCVVCGRCVRACRELRGVGVLYYKKTGKEFMTGTAADLPLAEAGCKFCGACAEVCPTGAIQDKKEELVKGKNRKASLIPCRYTCPAEIDVPGYVRFIKEGNYSAAVALVRDKVPLPGVLGYVCDRPCEDTCRRGEVNEAISIRELKRFAVEHDIEKSWKNINKNPATGKKVAIIGSGPAGLTAAYFLNKRGHEVTVFEALPAAGGMLRYGIPTYRLPRDILDAEIEYIVSSGVMLRTNTSIDSIDTLLNEGYDAALVTIGTHRGQKLKVPGTDSNRVLISVDFLREVNQGNKVDIGGKVMVMGGGKVAFDCARVARRLGAEVHLACLECREEMPATGEEIKQAEEEGVVVHPAKSLTAILNENGRITGAELVNVTSLSIDEDKNFNIEVDNNSGHVLEADTVIFAIGQRPEISPEFGVELGAGNLVTADQYTFSTSREGVFAAGDAITGTSSVIKAAASGRKAAAAIDRFLGGSGLFDEKAAAGIDYQKCIGYEEGFAFKKRAEETLVPGAERLKDFCKVVRDMDEKTADAECRRCLQCDLRLKITPVKFWGSY